jgi:alpha-acetolactate decarboxylase
MATIPPNHIYQYSLVNALMAGISSGPSCIPPSTLLSHGTHGLGTFAHIDGELLLLDSTIYRLQAHGSISIVPATSSLPQDQIPYAIATRFVPSKTLRTKLAGKGAVDDVLESMAPHTSNLFLSYTISGSFSYLKTRTVRGTTQPNQSLAELGSTQFVAEYENIRGTIVGFRAPGNWQGFFVAGEHLHFVDEERKCGGHVLELRAEEGEGVEVNVAVVKDVHVELPTSEEFSGVQMRTDDEGLRGVEG